MLKIYFMMTNCYIVWQADGTLIKNVTIKYSSDERLHHNDGYEKSLRKFLNSLNGNL